VATRELYSTLGRSSAASPNTGTSTPGPNGPIGVGLRNFTGRVRAVATVAGLGSLMACGTTEPVPLAPVAVVARALTTCSSGGGDPFSEVNAVEVTVQEAGGALIQNARAGLSGNQVNIGGVPEGEDRIVTITGYVGDDARWFARSAQVDVERGRDNPVNATFSRLGGFSCPQTDAEFTHRLFPAVTALDGGFYLVSGGFTNVASGATTSFTTTDGSKKAFIYDSQTGALTRLESAMTTARGAHTAVTVRGATKSQVILIGGATKMTFDPNASDGFGWAFDIADAHSSVDVFEWNTGESPASGTFLTDVQGVMVAKRVFATAANISSDGLVLICDGGPWGGAQPPEYAECDVFDGAAHSFLDNSYNFPRQYRAGGSVATIETGDVTRLLYVGGTKGRMVELYRSSTEQRAGSGGTFTFPEGNYDDAPRTSFGSLSPLGNNRFAYIAGVRWNGSGFDQPSTDNAAILTVTENGASTNVEALPFGGLGVGRYFHTAGAPGFDRLSLLGGFTSGKSLEATSSVVQVQFDSGDPTLPIGLAPAPDSEDAFGARAGAASLLLANDTILIAGGIGGTADLETTAQGAFEIYTPSVVLPVAK
jgi:hypothetical protein